MRNALALESNVGIIETASPVVVRKACMADIPLVLDLINGYAGHGVMLPRTEFEISENIRDFTVAYAGSRLAGCGALHFYSPYSGELRSLAVELGLKGQGVGRKIVEALEQEARLFGLHSIFAFTYVQDFFGRLGFLEVERGELPLKVWKDCLRCPKFQSCDEVAVIKYLTSEPERGVSEHDSTELVQLPFLKPGHHP